MIEHRKWNRGHNGLHQLGQLVAPSILFPVFNPPYPQGREEFHLPNRTSSGSSGHSDDQRTESICQTRMTRKIGRKKAARLGDTP